MTSDQIFWFSLQLGLACWSVKRPSITFLGIQSIATILTITVTVAVVGALEGFFLVDLPETTKINKELFNDNASDIIPLFVFKVLADSYYQLVVLVGESAVDNQTAVIIHIFYTLVVLQVPYFDVAFRQRHKNIFAWQSIYRGNSTPMAFVNDAQLASGHVDEVNIHVFRTKE